MRRLINNRKTNSLNTSLLTSELREYENWMITLRGLSIAIEARMASLDTARDIQNRKLEELRLKLAKLGEDL